MLFFMTVMQDGFWLVYMYTPVDLLIDTEEIGIPAREMRPQYIGGICN